MPLSVLTGLLVAILLWLIIDRLQMDNGNMGSIDPSILQVILLGFCSWLVLLAIVLSIMGSLISKIVLQLNNLFDPLKKLTSWQQYILYLALFAVLVLSGTGCLIAIC